MDCQKPRCIYSMEAIAKMKPHGEHTKEEVIDCRYVIPAFISCSYLGVQAPFASSSHTFRFASLYMLDILLSKLSKMESIPTYAFAACNLWKKEGHVTRYFNVIPVWNARHMWKRISTTFRDHSWLHPTLLGTRCCVPYVLAHPMMPRGRSNTCGLEDGIY